MSKDTELHLGDCFKVLEDIGYVDMVLTDPPYEISTSSGGGMMGKGGRKYMEDMSLGLKVGIDIKLLLDTLLTKFKSKNHFNGVFFCSNKQLEMYLSWARENKLQFGVGVWHKTNPPPLCNFKYLNDVEYWVYIKGNKSKILGDYHSKSLVYPSQINKTDKKLYNHPTIKPQDILKKFLINHTAVGDIVLDPFMGVGSTGVACKALERKFVGIELDDTYFETARKRIEDVQ